MPFEVLKHLEKYFGSEKPHEYAMSLMLFTVLVSCWQACLMRASFKKSAGVSPNRLLVLRFRLERDVAVAAAISSTLMSLLPRFSVTKVMRRSMNMLSSSDIFVSRLMLCVVMSAWSLSPIKRKYASRFSLRYFLSKRI